MGTANDGSMSLLVSGLEIFTQIILLLLEPSGTENLSSVNPISIWDEEGKINDYYWERVKRAIEKQGERREREWDKHDIVNEYIILLIS